MDFTEWLGGLRTLGDIARVLAGFGVVAVFLAYLKHSAERRCWRSFKMRVVDWVDDLVQSENRHPKELREDEWRAACERMLTDANLSPLQINQMLEVSVVVAKGIAADKIFS